MSKAGYEPVANVPGEAAVEPTSTDYADLAPDQAAVLQTMDATLRSADHDSPFALPDVDPSVLKGQGRSCAYSLVLPTVTLLATVVAALGLEAYHKHSDISSSENPILSLLLQYFPYASAVVMYLASVPSLVARFAAAAAPVFAQMDSVEANVKEHVGQMARKVDDQIDSMEQQVERILQPVQPVLQKAAKQAVPLQKLDKTLEIPPQNSANAVTESFQEMKGVVQAKAVSFQEDHVGGVRQALPGQLQSWNGMFWRVVFPVLLVSMLCQVGVAWACQMYLVLPAAVDGGPSPSRRFLRGSPTATAISASGGSLATRVADRTAGLSMRRLLESNDAWVNTLETDVATDMAEIQTEVEEDAPEDQVLGLTVVAVYLMALLQLGLVYIFTTPHIQAVLVNRGLRNVSDETNRRLRQFGVAQVRQDVLGNQLARIRAKLLQTLRNAAKLEAALAKLSASASAVDDTKDKAEMLGKTKKKKSLLAKIFS